ncbi:MAG: DUF1778 domain-containing protein [Thermodesulfobacteriota bacterium]|nr:DUF1778 domain-containing protein [Thermodesulfobacteriota bacterium]
MNYDEQSNKDSPGSTQARLDPKSKQAVIQAAKLRHVGLSGYIRLVLVLTAKKEVEQAKNQVLQMTADEQERFWLALQVPVKLTKAQCKLGKIMRGDAPNSQQLNITIKFNSLTIAI